MRAPGHRSRERGARSPPAPVSSRASQIRPDRARPPRPRGAGPGRRWPPPGGAARAAGCAPHATPWPRAPRRPARRAATAAGPTAAGRARRSRRAQAVPPHRAERAAAGRARPKRSGQRGGDRRPQRAGQPRVGQHVEVGVHAAHLLVDLVGRAERGQPQPGRRRATTACSAPAERANETNVASPRASPQLVERDQLAHDPGAGAGPAARADLRLELRAPLVQRRRRPRDPARPRATSRRSGAARPAARRRPRIVGRADRGQPGRRPRGPARRRRGRLRGRPDRSAIDRSSSASRRPCTAAAVARSMLPKLAW